MKVRLDRGVATSEWRDMFPDAVVQHLVSPRSDHCPLWLNLKPPEERPAQRIQWYEIMWEREQSLGNVISDAWSEVCSKNNLGDIASTLSTVIRRLHAWSSEHFGSVRKELEALRKQLAELQQQQRSENQAEI